MKNKIFAVVLSAMFVVVLIFSFCGKSQDKEIQKEVEPNQTVCPVMGNQINMEVYVDYQGKRVYFCCADCIEIFKENPEKYLEKLKKQGVILEDVATI